MTNKFKNLLKRLGNQEIFKKGKNKYVVLYHTYPEFIFEAKSTFIRKKYESFFLINANNLEDVFFKMQGENWSPNGEAREVIQHLDAHTSMMIGDVIYDVENKKYVMVDTCGFKETKKYYKQKTPFSK